MKAKAPKRLIEVALPIREISAESIRDKSLRPGHISTLHLWWARRPLPASRAIVFASLVPDPDDPNCPPAFRETVIRLLKEQVPHALMAYGRGSRWINDPDPYCPYGGMAETPRNRLLMFIAKWSPEWRAFERGENGKPPPPKQLLDDRCLVKWETSDPKNVQGRAVLRIARELVRSSAFDGASDTPLVLDPFAGGGAIPLEATRLGCQAIANDYNPVAYLILRATCEFPQRFFNHKEHEEREETQKTLVSLGDLGGSSRLAHDVEKWARWILERAREKIGHLYPPGRDGWPVVGYLWARIAPCSNPACRAEIPLLRSLLICNKPNKRVALVLNHQAHKEPKENLSALRALGGEITFGIAKDSDITRTDGTMLRRGDCRCPICEQITPVADLRRAGVEGKMGERMVAVIVEAKIQRVRRIGGRYVTVTTTEKQYRPVEPSDLEAVEEAKGLAQDVERPSEPILPEITGNDDEDISNSTGIRVHLYGMKTWGSLFNPRQLLAMQTFVTLLREALETLNNEGHKGHERHKEKLGDLRALGGLNPEYREAVVAYLGLWVSRIAQRSSNMGVWHTSRETLEHPFGRQAIPMTWDYPEANPFSESTGGALGGIGWIFRVVEHESPPPEAQFFPSQVLCQDGAHLPLETASANVVVTDPPYFDAIAYADLSDFFYVWLKRGLSDVFPEVFATPLTPKGDEATALKHRHGGDAEKAKQHFTSKLAACFAEAKRLCKPDGIHAVMFAHQSTEAWTALINALFETGLTVTATYPIDTELTTALKKKKSALESSISVICRPRQVGAAASFRQVRQEIERVVAESAHRFFEYGFRGADLIVACYGPAVGVFGGYERVERADGTPVEIPELLELAKEAALRAIAGEFQGDVLSRLYFVWANLYGVSEQAWDDARIVIQIGGDSEDAMDVARRDGLFVVNGSKCRLALLKDRGERRHLGENVAATLIDQLHRAMLFWKEERRADLVRYLSEHELLSHTPFWKLAQALFEVLPRAEEDWKLISALLGERETLRLEAKRKADEKPGLFQ